MKANNLTVSIDAPCSKNCPYCISKMTFYPKPDPELFNRNIDKAVEMARLASVNSVLISSKGEPLQRIEQVKFCAKAFETFPLEIQTNGEMLLGMGMIDYLYGMGFNTIAISIDSFEQIERFATTYKLITHIGMNVRLTIVLSSLWTLTDGEKLLDSCLAHKIKQITFRVVTIPFKLENTEAAQRTVRWIDGNLNYEKLSAFLQAFRKYETPENLIRELPFGPKVYSMREVAVTLMPYCVQENNNTEDIRSLIYHQDGHMYTSWDKPASILF